MLLFACSVFVQLGLCVLLPVQPRFSLTLFPSVWSSPEPVMGDSTSSTAGWALAVPAGPSPRAVCPFGPFSFHLHFHRSLASPMGFPFGHPKCRKAAERLALGPVSSRLVLLLHPHPPEVLHCSPCTTIFPLLLFFLLA